MADYNKVILLGRMTRDAELRYTSSGNAVANIDLAVNRKYTKADGEKGEETLFQRVTIWGKQAETLATYTEKGSQLLVEGRLKGEEYENKDGITVYNKVVVAESFQFVDGNRKNSSSEETASESKPSAGKKVAKKTSKKKAAPVDEDDIPF